MLAGVGEAAELVAFARALVVWVMGLCLRVRGDVRGDVRGGQMRGWLRGFKFMG